MTRLLKKVDVLESTNSQYEVLHHFGQKVHEAFLSLGYQCRLLKQHQWVDVLSEDPPDFTLAFNGAPKDNSGVFLCDYLKIPHVSCLVDPPFRFTDVVQSPYIITTCDDQFCSEAFRTPKTPNLFFFPHSVERELALEPMQLDRTYDAIMLGTFIEFEHRRLHWQETYPENLCQALDRAAEITLSDGKTNFIQAFHQAVKNIEIPATLDIASVLMELEFYIKGLDRINLLRSIKDVEVHVFGGSTDPLIGWERYLGNQSNIIIHGPVNFLEAIALMKKSKIILNSGIKNKNGAHERLFTGMACGALVVTNENLYTNAHFKEKENIVVYQSLHLGALNDKLISFITHEQKRQTVIQNAREEILNNHTWDIRLKTLMDEIEPVLLTLKH